MALIQPENFKDYEKDNSPTRKRSKIINYVFGSTAKWVSIFIAAAVPFFFIGFAESRVAFSFAYIMMMAILFILVYFFFFYWVANIFYQQDVKVK